MKLPPASTPLGPLVLSPWAFEHQIGPLEDCAVQGQTQASESPPAGASGKQTSWGEGRDAAMRGDIAQLVKIITTMKIAASLECHVLQHCALPGHKLIPIFQKEGGGGRIEQGCEPGEPGSTLQSSLNHWVSVSPQAAWHLPRLCPTPTDTLVGGARQPLWQGLAFAL